MFSSIRSRLTFYYAAALAVMLSVFGTFFYFVADRAVRGLADDSIEDAATSLITTLKSGSRPQSGSGPTNQAIAETLRDFRFQNIVFAVFDESGKPVALSPRLDDKDGSGSRPFNIAAGEIPLARLAETAREGGGFTTIKGLGGSEIRIFAASSNFERGTLAVAAIRPLTSQIAILAEIRLFMFAGFPFALLLASIGGYYLAGKSLGPVADMAEKAADITSSNLSERLPRGTVDDELAGLADTFNAMLDRLESAFSQQRRFMADASHELRTPLSIIRGESDVALQRSSRAETEYREALGIIGSEGERLTKIVDDLFTLAKTDSPSFTPARSKFYLDEVIHECARSVRSLVEEKGKKMTVTAADGMMCTGDEELVRRMIVNLLDNAVKYSGAGGEIKIECVPAGGNFVLSVSNTGDPISESDSGRIFERFYRSDKARSHTDGAGTGSGAGLGLPIARSIVLAHEGSIELLRSDAESTVFTVTLPAG